MHCLEDTAFAVDFTAGVGKEIAVARPAIGYSRVSRRQSFTVRENVVVCVSEPDVAVMVTVDVLE
jgi:hypothetical protein